MKLLVIGSTSFLGSAIARYAKSEGHEVVGYCRSAEKSKDEVDSTMPVIEGSLETLVREKSRLLSQGFDAVVHTIAYTKEHAEAAIAIFDGFKGPLIIISSVDCYDAFQRLNRGLGECDFPIKEDAPTFPERFYWSKQDIYPYSEQYDKNLVTEVVMNATERGRVRGIVLRLTSVYGPGDKKFQFHGRVIRQILDKQKTLLFGATEQGFIMNQGYIDNVASAVIHAAKEERCVGQVFNIGETEVRSLRRWAELFGKAGSFKFDIKVLPDEMALSYQGLMHRPPRHLIFSCDDFVEKTGFCPPVSLEEGIRRTFEWAKSHPESLPASASYADQAEMINAYEKFAAMWIDP